MEAFKQPDTADQGMESDNPTVPLAVFASLVDWVRSPDTSALPPEAIAQKSPSLYTSLCLMQASPLPMFIMWGKTASILPNPACCETLGIAVADWAGRPGADVWGATWDSLAPLVAQVMQTGQALTTQPLPGLSLSPTTHNTPTIALSICPIWGDRARVEGVICIGNYGQAEADGAIAHPTAAYEERSPFPKSLADVEVETIYQSVPIGLNVLDRNLRFVRVNKRLAEINGFSVEEHIGRTVRELLPDLADVAETMLRPVLDEGKPLLNVEITGETPAMPGVQRTWIESFLPLKDGDRVIGISTVCEEITERKRMEAARQEAEAALRQAKEELEQRVTERTAELQHLNANLQQSEVQLRRYERIVSTITDGICLLDCHGVYQIANQTYLSWHQKSADEIIGHSIQEVLGETLFHQTIQPYLQRCLAGETVQFELWLNYPVLGPQFISVSYVPYIAADCHISGVIVALRNLTRLYVTEQALRDSELRFRSISDQTYQFIGLLAPDGTLLEANQTALKFGGIDRETVIGQPFWETIWWTTSPAAQEQLRQAIARAAQGEFVRYEVEVQGAEAQTVAIDFSLRPVFNDAGAVVLLIPEGRDISDRKQAEKQLELQAIVTRNMAEGICLVRADNGIIVYANPKFEQMFGYSPHELEGQHVSIVNYATEGVSAEDVNQAIRSAVLANQEATYEVQNIKKDGTPFWCSATTSVFEHPDYGTVLVAVHQDISDRKHFEAERDQAETQVRASLKEKELLLKEIYHRVKNNLQVIYSLLNLQSRHLQDPAALAALKDSQSRIRAMALVHEKLYSSRDLSQIDAVEYITSLARSLLESYRTTNHTPKLVLKLDTFWLDVETAIPCGLILTELLSNSLKHAFTGYPQNNLQEEICVTSSLTAQNEIILRIQDNGIGLPANFDLTTVSSLGLQLVRNLAQQINGTIILNAIARGTAFQVQFPLNSR